MATELSVISSPSSQERGASVHRSLSADALQGPGTHTPHLFEGNSPPLKALLLLYNLCPIEESLHDPQPLLAESLRSMTPKHHSKELSERRITVNLNDFLRSLTFKKGRWIWPLQIKNRLRSWASWSDLNRHSELAPTGNSAAKAGVRNRQSLELGSWAPTSSHLWISSSLPPAFIIAPTFTSSLYSTNPHWALHLLCASLYILPLKSSQWFQDSPKARDQGMWLWSGKRKSPVPRTSRWELKEEWGKWGWLRGMNLSQQMHAIFPLKKIHSGHFPGGSVARTTCRGSGFNPWSGNEMPYATTKIQRGQLSK